jgi:hypothetical protein
MPEICTVIVQLHPGDKFEMGNGRAFTCGQTRRSHPLPPGVSCASRNRVERENRHVKHIWLSGINGAIRGAIPSSCMDRMLTFARVSSHVSEGVLRLSAVRFPAESLSLTQRVALLQLTQLAPAASVLPSLQRWSVLMVGPALGALVREEI